MKFFSSKKRLTEQNQKGSSSTSGVSGKPGLFSRLTRTRDGLFSGIATLFTGHALDDGHFDEIEDQLLVADLGVAVSQKIIAQLKSDAKANRLNDTQALVASLRQVLLEILRPCEVDEFQLNPERPVVVMMVGVNGVGKTTTLAKLAARFNESGQKVMLAACDTFRAAAIEQLQTWGNRLNIPVIAQSHGADAAAVAFDAYTSARARNSDVLLIDTAGRQHTHSELVEQLIKVKRVLTKAEDNVPDEIWLTVDAGNGQNVLSQVEHFHNAVNLTGICVTKLDGTAKGGVMFALAERFALPIQYIGTGEAVEDLRRFDAEAFVDALLPELPQA